MYIEAVYRFLEYLKNIKNGSEHTLRNYAIDLNGLKQFLEKEHCKETPQDQLPEKIKYNEHFQSRITTHDHQISLSQIDRKTIRGFLAHENAQQQSKRTIVRRLSSIRTFFKYCVKQKFIEINPTEDLESPKLDKKIPYSLSYEEVKTLFDQPDTTDLLGFRDRAIMELFYSSGLRVSELAGLNRSDFDPHHLLLKVRGKGKKERIVPLTKNAAQWIKSYLEHPQRYLDADGHTQEKDREAIFINRHGTRLTTRSVDRKFDKYLLASGLAGKVTPHTIRHTIATHWLENGMDLKTIQVILGHSTPATTTIYTQVSTKLKRETHAKAHPRA